VPQVLPQIAFAAFSVGAPLVVVNAIVGVGVAGAVLHTAVSVAVTVGASYAIAKLTAPPIPRPSNGAFEFKQPIPTRFFTYGGVKISGPILFLETSNGNRHLNKITAFGTRELDAFVKYFLDGIDNTSLAVPVVGQPGVFEIPVLRDVGGSHGFARYHIGDPDQVADDRAVTELGTHPSNPWTTSHRLRGIPYAYALMYSGSVSAFPQAFPNGAIEFSVVGGVKVYDPRKDSTNGGSGSHRMNNPDSWEYSDNQRLCALDWLTWPEGYAKDWPRIDWASWVPQINLADENVPLKGGGTEKRYRVATKVSYDEPRSRVLHRLLQAGDQQLFTTADGLIGSRGGKWVAPTVSLSAEADFNEAFFQHGVSMMERVNEFQLTCMLPERDYSEFELEPWGNKTDPEYIAGIRRRVPLDLNMVPSQTQAQRLAKIYMAKRNPRWSGTVRTNFAGLDALGEDKISLQFAELHTTADPFDGPFWINGQIAFLPDRTGVTFPVASADPDSYTWVPSTDEQDLPEAPEAEAALQFEEAA
jgi:hypothetical protein